MKSSLVYVAKNLLCNKYKHVLEFGVYRGDSLRILTKILNNSYQIFGFDSFEGLPEQWIDMYGKQVGNGYKGRFTTNGIVPEIDGVIFYKGWFNETIPQYKIKFKLEPIALLYIDCDLYSSTKTIFDELGSNLLAGSIIIFDEWFYNHDSKYNDHEQRAFYEWVKQNNIHYELIDYHNSDCCHEEEQIIKIL